MLYAAKSRPCETPETGKVAVRVINHYGDEVPNVFVVWSLGRVCIFPACTKAVLF